MEKLKIYIRSIKYSVQENNQTVCCTMDTFLYSNDYTMDWTKNFVHIEVKTICKKPDKFSVITGKRVAKAKAFRSLYEKISKILKYEKTLREKKILSLENDLKRINRLKNNELQHLNDLSYGKDTCSRQID